MRTQLALIITLLVVFSSAVFYPAQAEKYRCEISENGCCFIVYDQSNVDVKELARIGDVPSEAAEKAYENYLANNRLGLSRISTDVESKKSYWGLKTKAVWYEQTVACDDKKIYFYDQAEKKAEENYNYPAIILAVFIFFLALLFGLRLAGIPRRIYLMMLGGYIFLWFWILLLLLFCSLLNLYCSSVIIVILISGMICFGLIGCFIGFAINHKVEEYLSKHQKENGKEKARVKRIEDNYFVFFLLALIILLPLLLNDLLLVYTLAGAAACAILLVFLFWQLAFLIYLLLKKANLGIRRRRGRKTKAENQPVQQ
jgi:hypothetical protein